MQIFHPEFRDENLASAYPFADDALLVNAAGDFFTPDTFIDAAFYPVGGRERMYISKVIVTHQTCTLQLGDAGTQLLATGTFDFATLAAAADDEDVVVEFFDVVGRPAGIILSDKLRLSIFQTWGVGTHVFLLGTTELVASVCMPTPQLGVTGIQTPDGTLMAGEVWLVGEDGVVLSHSTETVAGEDYEVIRVDVVGDPLFRRRLCSAPIFFQTPQFITGIRFRYACVDFVVQPNERGDLPISVASNEAADTVLRVRPVPGGLVIEAAGERLVGLQ